MKKQFVLTLAALTLAVTSCKKDKDNPSPEPTKTQLISGHNWVSVSRISNGVDLNDILSPCEKDNILNLKTDGTYTYDEGPTKCDSADMQTQNGTWRFINNETKLIFNTIDTSNVIKLTPDTLKVEGFYVDVQGMRNSVLSTFVQK